MTDTCVIGEADPFLARLLQRFAEASGLRVVRAQVGQEVLDLVRRERPAVVILDAELPGTMRGWAAMEAIREDPALRHIPMIHCSWHPEADALPVAGPMAAHLHKPELHYADFVAALDRAGWPDRKPD